MPTANWLDIANHKFYSIDSRAVLGSYINGTTLDSGEIGAGWYDGAFRTLGTGINSYPIGEFIHMALTKEEGVAQKLNVKGKLQSSNTQAGSIIYEDTRSV